MTRLFFLPAEYYLEGEAGMNTVKVMIRAKLDGKYPYLPAIVNGNGRIKQGVALVGGFAAWYAWEQEHWGTKYNVGLADFEPAEDSRIAVTPDKLYFQTAWSCPVPIFKLLAEKFPEHEITIRVYECMMRWRLADKGGTARGRPGPLSQDQIVPRIRGQPLILSRYLCSMSPTKPRSTTPAVSGPAELISPYQRSGLFSSQGG
jgi:hypothetical protein